MLSKTLKRTESVHSKTNTKTVLLTLKSLSSVGQNPKTASPLTVLPEDPSSIPCTHSQAPGDPIPLGSADAHPHVPIPTHTDLKKRKQWSCLDDKGRDVNKTLSVWKQSIHTDVC